MPDRSRPKQPPTRAGLTRLRDIPNVGPATVGDFKVLGIHSPSDLPGRDPYQLYDDLCRLTGIRHDPCVMDVFISAVRFMEGAPPLPWWKYTPERKAFLARAAARHARSIDGLVMVFLLAGTMLLCPVVVLGQTTVRADSSADVRAIVAARSRSNAAIARHDTVGIAREMMPDITIVTSTSSMETGAALNVSRMAATFARRPDTRWVRTPDAITVFDAWGVASERGQWVGTWTEPDGPLVIRGSYQAQWRRTDGTWRIQGELFVPLQCEGGAYCRTHP